MVPNIKSNQNPHVKPSIQSYKLEVNLISTIYDFNVKHTHGNEIDSKPCVR